VSTVLKMFLVLGLLASAAADAAAAATKKSRRDAMSEAQKKDLRKRAYEWCRKTYLKGGGGYIMRVEIMNDGRVRCWYKS
jgi:D-Tyr-tRNAtyr deacylase